MHYTIRNTLNASIANADLLAGGRGVSASEFDAGGFSAEQMTTNVDVARFYPGVMSGLNLAFGAEYRTENYKIFAGEPGSYIDVDGPGFGGDPGSQGFPGFRPADVTDRDRHSVAAYVDVETDVTDRLKVLTALRYENFSDFGSSVTGKVAAAPRRCSRHTSRRPSRNSSTAGRSTRCSRQTEAQSPMRSAFQS